MKVVLFRHATRSIQGLGDCPLSAEGLAQAENIPAFLTPQGPLPKPTHLFCSPKKRAQQTLQPLAENQALPLKIDPRLDERHQNESGADFETRIRSLIEDVASLSHRSLSGEAADAPALSSADSAEACVYLCSHLDWLETALVLLDSDLSDLEIASGWATAEFRIFRVQEDGLWALKSGGGIPTRL